MTTIRGTAHQVVRSDDGTRQLEPAAICAIPYYAWAHRTVGAMAVWLARTPAVVANGPRDQTGPSTAE